MTRRSPPFRADHVGSLLRPPSLLAARKKTAEGAMTLAELREIEDVEIKRVIAAQEAIGLRAVTDGELRRAYFHLDFLERLDGVSVEGAIAANSDAEKTVHFTPPRLSVTGRLRHARDIQVEDFKFLKAHVAHTPKITIPSPTMVHFRGGRAAIDIHSYPDLDLFFEDLAQCYRDEIAALYAAGCRYMQLDDTNLAYLCDPKMRQGARERGDDPDQLPRTYAALINAALRDKPSDLCVCVHLCRGNFRSAWFAEGGYEPVAEILFNEMNVDGYFLEYDDERSGDFSPLRFLPTHKIAVLGLVTSKRAALEPQTELLARIDEAARYAPLENLCLSPQCGFSSTEHGNDITEAEQWKKLALVADTARRVWGEP